MQDERIDFSDIPESTDEKLTRARNSWKRRKN